jgi:hypothetical protein
MGEILKDFMFSWLYPTLKVITAFVRLKYNK